MAPSPVLNIEPKGPDKNNGKYLNDVSQKDTQNTSNDNIDSNSKDKSTVESPSIHEIDEGELKTLLDEAYNYRSSKDREGKSILFQKFLNEVEESDASKKKLIDRSRGFVDGLKAASAIENTHDSASDQSFFSNILGGCEREKKKKKNSKRDGSSSNGTSRRAKFTHSLKINHGPQSSVYNGNISGSGSSSSANSYHCSGRTSSRTQQSLSARLSTSKATLLTSSSNIDIPMVTTYNKQPIMTPAVVPRKQQKTESVMLDLSNPKASCSNNETSVKNEEIELKSLNEVGSFNYTARASLEIDGSISSTNAKQIDTNEDSKYNGITEDTLISCSPRSSSALVNGNAEVSSQSLAVYKSFNGTFDNKEDDMIIVNDVDEEKQQLLSKKKNKQKKEISFTDIVSANGTSSVDEIKTGNFLPQKQLWPSTYPFPSTNLVIINATDSTSGRFMHSAKESFEARVKSGDEAMNNYQSKDGNGSASRLKKKKVKKPDINSYLSEHIEGHCGDKSIDYLLEYIEKNRSPGSGGGNASSHSINGTNQKSPRTKSTIGVASKHEKQSKGKACTDEDIRNRKPTKAKERLKKSTSLEDLRLNRSKSNKKQSSVDDSHYTHTDEVKLRSSSPVSVSLPPPVKKTETSKMQTPVDDETHLYYDSLIEDSYTETEFHLVTKKHRRKKRRSKSRITDQKTTGKSSISQGFLPHNYTDRNQENSGFKRSTRSTENRHRSRRKSVSSVVPSDKISDSDSIHSLPVSSTTPKCKVKKKSTSSGCTPQASYADIAKSPQCQSSMTLNGDATTAKWQSRTFSNVSSSNANSNVAAIICGSTNGSPNTGDSPDHSDNVELVSSMKYGDHVELDDGCDQLLLTCSNNVSNNSCSGFDSPAASVDNSSVEEIRNVDNNIYCGNINDSNNNNTDNDINHSTDVTQIGVTLKRKNNTNKNNENNVVSNNDNSNNNNTNNTNLNSYSHVCFNGKLEKSAVKDDPNPSTDTNNSNCKSNSNYISSSNNNNNNNNNNAAVATKTKKSKSKKKVSTEEHETVNQISVGDSPLKEKNGNDLFIEFTLKCVPTVKTKCSQTQTDLVEVNNNACCNDVSVEETVILKNNRNSGTSCHNESSSKSKKLSLTTSSSLPIVDETDGSRIIVLPSRADGTENNAVSVGFDINAKLLQEAAVKNDQRRRDMLKEIVDRSSKYNVSEVIQYVNKSWNEVMDSLSSPTKVTDAKKQVQYYDAK